MAKQILKILIVGETCSDADLKQQLSEESKNIQVQILFFENNEIAKDGIFDSTYPTDAYSISRKESRINCRTEQRVFNVDVSQQLASSLRQEYERRRDSHSLLFHDNLHANHMLWRTIEIYLIKNDVDSIVFLNRPHDLTENILYQVAKAKEMKTLILIQSIFHDKFFSIQSLCDFGNLNRKNESSPTNNRDQPTNFTLDSHSQVHSRCEGSTVRDVLNLFFYLFKIRSIKIFDPLYFIRQTHHIHDAPTCSKDWIDPFSRFFSRKKTAYFEFFTNSFDTSTIQNQKYIYFPLQSLGDLYTEVTYNRFSDQVLAIEQLARLIPDDYKIIIKHDGIGCADYLTPMFFHRVRRISSVIYVPSCVDSNLLIKHCELLSTVNSCQGWTALIMGKKSLLFGHPWYCNLPGAYIYRADFSFQQILDLKFSTIDLENQVKYLLSQSHPGRLDSTVSSNSESKNNLPAFNAKKVAQVIFKLIRNEVDTTFRSHRV